MFSNNKKENKKQPASPAGDVQPGAGRSAMQLKDNRPGSIAQKKLADAIGAKATAQKKENKTGLPDHLKSGVENLSGISMDDVKVHYASDKPAQLNAHAYAQGTNIHIAPGQEKHLPHEAWHVVQQKQGRVKPTMQMKGNVHINDDKGLEKEADVMGGRALQMRPGTGSGIKISSKRPSLVQQNMAVQLRSIIQNAVEGKTGWNDAAGNFNSKFKHNTTGDWAAIQRIAFEDLNTHIEKKSQGETAQMLEKSTWEIISDAVTITGIVGTAITTIAKAASAKGLGWIAPMALGPIATFATTMMSTFEKTDDQKSKSQKVITAVINLVGALMVGVMGALATSQESGGSVFSILATILTLVIMTILEVLRVKYLDRNSIYKVVWEKIKECRQGGTEQQSLL